MLNLMEAPHFVAENGYNQIGEAATFNGPVTLKEITAEGFSETVYGVGTKASLTFATLTHNGDGSSIVLSAREAKAHCL